MTHLTLCLDPPGMGFLEYTTFDGMHSNLMPFSFFFSLSFTSFWNFFQCFFFFQHRVDFAFCSGFPFFPMLPNFFRWDDLGLQDLLGVFHAFHSFAQSTNHSHLTHGCFLIIFNHRSHLFFDDSSDSSFDLPLLCLLFLCFHRRIQSSHCCFLPQPSSCWKIIQNLGFKANPNTMLYRLWSLFHQNFGDSWSLAFLPHPMTMFFNWWAQIADMFHHRIKTSPPPCPLPHSYLLQKGWKRRNLVEANTSVDLVDVSQSPRPPISLDLGMVQDSPDLSLDGFDGHFCTAVGSGVIASSATQNDASWWCPSSKRSRKLVASVGVDLGNCKSIDLQLHEHVHGSGWNFPRSFGGHGKCQTKNSNFRFFF